MTWATGNRSATIRNRPCERRISTGSPRQGMRFTDAHSGGVRLHADTLRRAHRPLSLRASGSLACCTTFSADHPNDRLTVASCSNSTATTPRASANGTSAWTGVAKQGESGGRQRCPTAPMPGFDSSTATPSARALDHHRAGQGRRARRDVEIQPLMIAESRRWIGDQAQAEQALLPLFPACPPHTPIVPAPEFAGKSGARTW